MQKQNLAYDHLLKQEKLILGIKKIIDLLRKTSLVETIRIETKLKSATTSLLLIQVSLKF